jgi:hypothetical protein
MPIFRYIILPLAVLGIACFLFWESAKRYPVYAFSAVAIWIGVVLIRAQLHKKRDRHRGWRVGHVGRDSMFYEEFTDGAWHRIEIDGEMLVGKAHHVIYFASLKYPAWARERRDEIIARIKSEFHPPQYEYDDT